MRKSEGQETREQRARESEKGKDGNEVAVPQSGRYPCEAGYRSQVTGDEVMAE